MIVSQRFPDGLRHLRYAKLVVRQSQDRDHVAV